MESQAVANVPANDQRPATTNDLLALDGERKVTFKDKGAQLTFTFNRIGDAQWKNFFSGIVLESEKSGTTRTDVFDFRSTRIALFDAAIARVEGYQLREGRFEDIPNWKTRVRYGHKLAAVELLENVTASEQGEPFLDPEVESVFLDAAWGLGDDGKMKKYLGLAHRFTPPNAEQQRRLTRATSKASVVGGSRAGKTIYPTNQTMLAELYDQLVIAVEGYSVKGKPLAAVDEVRREMDTFHKVAAVQQLFATPETED